MIRAKIAASAATAITITVFACLAQAANPRTEMSTYTIVTLKSGQSIGTRKTEAAELRNAAIALTEAFPENVPGYENLLSVAKGMTAKDRCFNLFSSRVAMALIEADMLDASQNAEAFLKNSISSLEAVNSQTEITCEMR